MAQLTTVSRNSLQTIPQLAGESKYYFTDRAARNAYFGADSIPNGQYCAVGGNPQSTDWTAAVWTVEQFIDNNWLVISLDSNFTLIVTNAGLLALNDADTGSYKLSISRIAIKQTSAASGDELRSWTADTFFNSNGRTDICLDTDNSINNPTFTLKNNLTYRTNLMNGGIQYTLLLDVDTLGQMSEEVRAPATLIEYNVAMIGLFVKNANDDGGETLFAIANLPNPIKKYVTGPNKDRNQIGNALKFYLNLTLSNLGTTTNVEYLDSSVNSVPEITTEDKLPQTYDGVNAPYNLYLIDNLADTNVPALAVRKGNPVDMNVPLSWTFFTPTDDRLEIPDSVISNKLQNYMIAAWDINDKQYVPADGEKSDTQQLAGLYIGNHILYAGKVVNNQSAYDYTYRINTAEAKDYRIGETLIANIPTTEGTTVLFTIKILNINNGGVPTEFYVTPTEGNTEISMENTYIAADYPADYASNGQGLGLKINVNSIANSGVIWDLANDINKPLYVGTGEKAGLLTSTQTSMFVGWCIAHNAIKLALDLRNEANDVVYGTTRYATDVEIYSASTETEAGLSTSVTPKRLQENYIQKTNISGNPGDSASNPITVDTHLTFTKQLVSTASGVAFQGTAYRALWGDLAEYYRADKLYPNGTLITIGDGNEEITEAKVECNGIISSKPGYELGSKESAFDLPVALVGKVPVLFAPDCLPRFGDRVYLSQSYPGKASNIPFGKCLGKIIDKRPHLDQVNSIMCSVRIAF